MQIHGIIKSINETQVVSEKFKKREFVLEIDGHTQYPQLIPLEFQQEKVTLLNTRTIGEDVSVDFNLKGRQWTNTQGEVKTFLTLHAWKIESVNNSSAPTQQENNDASASNDALPGGDLPF